MATLAGYEDDAPFVRRFDQRFHTKVGKIGLSQHIHDPPGLIGLVANEFPPDRVTNTTPCAITAHNILGTDGL